MKKKTKFIFLLLHFSEKKERDNQNNKQLQKVQRTDVKFGKSNFEVQNEF